MVSLGPCSFFLAEFSRKKDLPGDLIAEVHARRARDPRKFQEAMRDAGRAAGRQGPGRAPAGPRQGPGRTPAGPRQGPGRAPAAVSIVMRLPQWMVNKNGRSQK